MTWIVNDASNIVSRAQSVETAEHVSDELEWERIQQGKSQQEEDATYEDKKIGAKSSDPNRYSQPRLPGSVVGEASMPPTRNCHKITKVSVLK
jgi:hypothetical protein